MTFRRASWGVGVLPQMTRKMKQRQGSWNKWLPMLCFHGFGGKTARFVLGRFDLHTENVHRKRKEISGAAVSNQTAVHQSHQSLPLDRGSHAVASSPPEQSGGCKMNINIDEKRFWWIWWLNRTASFLLSWKDLTKWIWNPGLPSLLPDLDQM